MTPTFQGEVQFRRWSDSSTQGVQITFALPDASDLEPLKTKAGKRFMAVLVEIGDDEQPVQPQPKKDTRGPLCKEACDLCDVPDFLTYAQAETKAEAADYIRATCGINTRTELDAYPEAGVAFKERVRVPFMRWQRERRAG